MAKVERKGKIKNAKKSKDMLRKKEKKEKKTSYW